MSIMFIMLLLELSQYLLYFHKSIGHDPKDYYLLLEAE